MLHTMKSTTFYLLRSGAFCAFLLFVLFWSTLIANAQNPVQPKRGFYPAGSYALSDLETINTTNGNLIVRLPLVSLPPGRGGLSAGVGLYYNSKVWETYSFQDERFEDGSYTTIVRPSPSGSWRYGLKYEMVMTTRSQENNPLHPACGDEYLNNNKVKLRFPDGSEHVFRPSGYTDPLGDSYFRLRPDGWMTNCPGIADSHVVFSGMTYYSADGTFMRLTFAPDNDNIPYNNPWTLSMPDGSRVTGADQDATERIYDRNGNYVEIKKITYNSHDATEVLDQMGRHIIVEYGTNGTDYVRTWRNDANGQLAELIWTINWVVIGVTERYYANPNDTITGTTFGPEGGPGAISQLMLPSQTGGLSYTFNYNDSTSTEGWKWGELNRMTLPSGAQVKYSYATTGDPFTPSGILHSYPFQKEVTYDRVYDGASTPASEIWQYSLDEFSSQMTAPDGGITREYFKQTNVDTWDSGLVYRSETPDGHVIERLWQQNIPYGYGTSTPAKANSYLKTEYTSLRNTAGTLVMTAIKDTTYDKNGNLTQSSESDWVAYSSVHSGSNPTWAVTGITRSSVNTYYNPTPFASSSAFDQDIYTQYTAPNIRTSMESSEARSGAGTTFSRTQFVYDDPAVKGNLIEQRTWDSTKGGLTIPLTSGTNNSISVTHQYDSYGNRTMTTDAALHQTQFVYGAIGSVTDLYPTQIKMAFGTGVVRTETRQYDFPSGLVTRSTDVDNNVVTSTAYDVFSRPVLVKAAESEPEETRTLTEYSDVNRRVIVRSDLNLAGDGKMVTIQHYDQLGRVRLSRQLEDSATQSATDETNGIKVQTRYQFSGSNSYSLTSNSFRAALSSSAGSEPTMGWTRSKSDNGGRMVETQTFGGAGLPAPWGSSTTTTGTIATAYDAEFTTVTDQGLRVRRSKVDGIGRLIRVDEPDPTIGDLGTTGSPVQPTSYIYDPLGNLRQTTQGTQNRYFMYDSLSRLLRADNPEQDVNNNLATAPDQVTGHAAWCIAYDYYDNGNIFHKTDARGVVSTFVYDALDRNTSVVYTSDPAGTPSVTRAYDGATRGKGRLWSTQTSGLAGSITIIDIYDALGRPKTAQQQFYVENGQPQWKSFTEVLTYDLAGHTLSAKYPSNRTVNYAYDNAGRNISLAGNLGDGASQRNYSSGISYSPLGTLSQEQFGTTTPVYNKLYYNPRGQLGEIRVGTEPNNTSWNRGAIINNYCDACWGAWYPASGMPDNNGNLKSQDYYIPTVDVPQPGNGQYTTPSQRFEYDQLNRLTRIYEGSSSSPIWQQQYVYDRFGNRTLADVPNSLLLKTFEVQTAKNRLLAPGDSNLSEPARQMRYDKAGNLTNDSYSYTVTTQGLRTYDAESRTTQAVVNGQSNVYTYDGNGQRVRRKINSVETWQIYSVVGPLLAEYAASASAGSPQKEYAYRNGQLLITAKATIGWGAPPALQDNPLNDPQNPESLKVKAIHITELRAAINALRSHYNLANYQWQKPTASGGAINNTVLVSWEPIDEMRLTLDETLGAPPSGYAAGLAQGQPIKAIHIQELRNRVLTAWVTGSGTDLRWLVSDQLGSPRIILDQSGSLLSVTRHDYLPYGEDLTAGARNSSIGYANTDEARQKFTSKERDGETALDYFGARYYSAIQGRFTGGDPKISSGKLADPQTLNRYSYVAGRPTIAIDPDGRSIIVVVVTPSTQNASVRLDARNGTEVRDFSGQARGQGRDRTRVNNDTPFGVYKPTANDFHGGNANGTQGGVSGTAARNDNSRFGTGILYMTPVSGEVATNHRDTIYIHGGPGLQDDQQLADTRGCVRLKNADMNTLVSDVNNLADNCADPLTNIFVGDVATLTAIADERNQDGTYKYEELRNSGFGTNNTQPHSSEDPQQNDDD